MKPLFIPWSLNEYLNGAHPLLASYLDSLQARFSIVTPADPPVVSREALAHDCLRFAVELVELSGVSRDTALQFVAARHHLSDVAAPPESLVFHHTTIPSLKHDSILHFENPILFFWPALRHGKFTRGASLLDHPYHPLIRATLAHPCMKKIISHSPTGLQYLRALFPEQAIQSKTEYIPLLQFVASGVHRARRAARYQPVIGSERRRRMLFTNSFHGYADSFWLRGGVTALLAFDRVRREASVELQIVSRIPDDLPPEVVKVLRDPDVHVVDRVSETELQALHDRADILILPSVCLHSMSLAKAVCSGTFVVGSDAPGVEDILTDPALGRIVQGTARSRAYFDDARTAMRLDDFSDIKQINFDNINAVTTALLEALQVPPGHRTAYQPSRDDLEAPSKLNDLFVDLCVT